MEVPFFPLGAVAGFIFVAVSSLAVVGIIWWLFTHVFIFDKPDQQEKKPVKDEADPENPR